MTTKREAKPRTFEDAYECDILVYAFLKQQTQGILDLIDLQIGEYVQTTSLNDAAAATLRARILYELGTTVKHHE